MASVQVLCPNGRRQNVKITPNTKILQILEEVCQKQGFLPSEDYKLIHGRKTLDVTLSVRYAGLPNNAKLELVKSQSSREEHEVTVALQLEDGQRLQNKFSPSMTLWEILLHWENINNSAHSGKLTETDSTCNPAVHPVCIYMREEIIGEPALQITTLRKLGLTTGSAVLRLMHRPVDDAVYATVLDTLEKDQVKQAKLSSLATKHSQVSEKQMISQEDTERKTEMKAVSTVVDESSSDMSARVTESRSDEPMEIEQGQNSKTSLNSSSHEKIDSTDQGKCKKSIVKTTGQTESGAILSLRELNIPGVEVYTPNDFAELTSEQQEVARRLAQTVLPGLMSQHSSSTQHRDRNQAPPMMDFSDFKFPEETKGQDLYHNEFSDVNKEDFKPCDREAVVYNMEATYGDRQQDQEAVLPDEFFEVTEHDIRKLMSAQHKVVNSLNDQPLMTVAMKQRELEMKYSKYERVILRIQFPNKFVLQGVFRLRETVHSLKKFVRENLEDKNLPFYLYTAPPKCILKDDTKTFMEAELVPATLVYFGSDVNKDHYLSSALMETVSSRTKADEIVAHWLSSSTGDSSTEIQDDSQPRASKRQTGGSGEGTATKDGGTGVPKWLKLGGKK